MTRHGVAALLAVAITAAVGPLHAADDGSGTLETLEGGALSSDTRISVGFLYGAGGRPGGLGSPTSTVGAGVAAVAGNPAGLAFLTRNGFLLDVLPPIAASISELADLETRAATMVDEAVEDAASRDLEPAYPRLDVSVGQQAGIVSGALAIRIGPVVAGAAIEEPLSVRLDLVETGIEAFAAAVKSEGDGDVDIELRCFADAAAEIAFEIEKTTLALGSEIAPGVGVGLSLSHYYGRANASAVLRADGIISYGGQEHAFNDPSDPWDNALGLSGWGAYRGEAIGWSGGASWRARDWLTVDVLYASVPLLSLHGTLTTVENTIPAAADGGLELEEVSAAEPTLTERTETVEDDPLVLHLPSYTGLAVSMRAWRVVTTLEYRRYSGLLGFEFRDDREGIQPTDGAGIEADFGGLRLGGGLIRGRFWGESSDGGGDGDVLIPMANAGFQFELGESMTMDLLLVAVPLQVLRLSFDYSF